MAEQSATKKLFYSESELDKMGILSRPTRWRLRQEGLFPNTVKLSVGRVAYSATSIHEWVEKQTASAS